MISPIKRSEIFSGDDPESCPPADSDIQVMNMQINNCLYMLWLKLNRKIITDKTAFFTEPKITKIIFLTLIQNNEYAKRVTLYTGKPSKIYYFNLLLSLLIFNFASFSGK